MKIIEPDSKQTYGTAVVLAIIGLFLCIFNVSILTIIARIIGIVFIGLFVLYFYQFFIKRNTAYNSFFALSCVTFIFGLYLTINPDQIVKISPVLVGIVLIVNSLFQIQKALILKDQDFKNWQVNLIVAVILMVVGILLFLKPIQSLEFVFQLAGVLLIADAIVIIVNRIMIDKSSKTFEN